MYFGSYLPLPNYLMRGRYFKTLQDALAVAKEPCEISVFESGILRVVTEEEKQIARCANQIKRGKNCYAVHMPEDPGSDYEYQTLEEAALAKTGAGDVIYALDENGNERELTSQERADAKLIISIRFIETPKRR